MKKLFFALMSMMLVNYTVASDGFTNIVPGSRNNHPDEYFRNVNDNPSTNPRTSNLDGDAIPTRNLHSDAELQAEFKALMNKYGAEKFAAQFKDLTGNGIKQLQNEGNELLRNAQDYANKGNSVIQHHADRALGTVEERPKNIGFENVGKSVYDYFNNLNQNGKHDVEKPAKGDFDVFESGKNIFDGLLSNLGRDDKKQKSKEPGFIRNVFNNFPKAVDGVVEEFAKVGKDGADFGMLVTNAVSSGVDTVKDIGLVVPRAPLKFVSTLLEHDKK